MTEASIPQAQHLATLVNDFKCGKSDQIISALHVLLLHMRMIHLSLSSERQSKNQDIATDAQARAGFRRFCLLSAEILPAA